jgi:DNA-binding LacI/PurR family transcriptional regulator
MTLEEVAKRARVSTATVSRVLNNIDVVSEATRKRVLRAATELRYHPNVYARTLAGGRGCTFWRR